MKITIIFCEKAKRFQKHNREVQKNVVRTNSFYDAFLSQTKGLLEFHDNHAEKFTPEKIKSAQKLQSALNEFFPGFAHMVKVG